MTAILGLTGFEWTLISILIVILSATIAALIATLWAKDLREKIEELKREKKQIDRSTSRRDEQGLIVALGDLHRSLHSLPADAAPVEAEAVRKALAAVFDALGIDAGG